MLRYPVGMADLTDKQKRFVEEYLIDLNATQAAIRAGYSEKTADQIGSELLRKTKVSEAVNAAMERRSQKTKIDAEYVLMQAVKLHERCMQEIEPFTDRKGNHVHDEHGRPVYIFDSKGAAASLALVGKHVNVQAFKEQIEHSGTVNLADRMAAGRRRALGESDDDDA